MGGAAAAAKVGVMEAGGNKVGRELGGRQQGGRELGGRDQGAKWCKVAKVSAERDRGRRQGGRELGGRQQSGRWRLAWARARLEASRWARVSWAGSKVDGGQGEREQDGRQQGEQRPRWARVR